MAAAAAAANKDTDTKTDATHYSVHPYANALSSTSVFKDAAAKCIQHAHERIAFNEQLFQYLLFTVACGAQPKLRLHKIYDLIPVWATDIGDCMYPVASEHNIDSLVDALKTNGFTVKYCDDDEMFITWTL
jgi:hypothetical protein